MTVRASGIVLTEIDTPLYLPNNERHVAGQGETLEDALADIGERYTLERLSLERVYYSRSDERFWFVLNGGGGHG